MIKFFRRIRQKLLSENKFSKYLIYGLGEILLVVVGILIALQVNNWNEHNKSLESEQLILMDLKNEISSNISKLKMTIEINRRSLQTAEFLCSVYDNPEMISTINQDTLFGLVSILPGAVFVAEEGILNSIVNSGQIKMIRNNVLKSHLSSLSDHVQLRSRLNKEIQELGGGYYLDKVVFPQIASVIENGKVVEQNPISMFEIPSFYIAVCGTFRGRRLTAAEFEKEILTLYGDVMNLIDNEIMIN
jgi:hypothetical protein